MNSHEHSPVASGLPGQTGSVPDVATEPNPVASGVSPDRTPPDPDLRSSVREAELPLCASSASQIANQNSKIENSPILGEYRGNGFVARLPKTLRDQINQ